MNKYILHNHATGEFFEEHTTERLESIIISQLRDGYDVGDLSVYRAKKMIILPAEEIVTKVDICEFIDKNTD